MPTIPDTAPDGKPPTKELARALINARIELAMAQDAQEKANNAASAADLVYKTAVHDYLKAHDQVSVMTVLRNFSIVLKMAEIEVGEA